MNLESLIQETAKKVIANLEKNPKTEINSVEKCSAITRPACNIITIVDGIKEGLNHAISEVKSVVNSGLSLQVVLSKNVDSSEIKLEGVEVISPRAIVELIRDCVIYIPYLSLGLAAKIANLIEDEAASRVVSRGILGQHKIFIGISEIDLLLAGKERLTFGLSQRLKEYKRLLKAYDLVMIKDLNEVLKACNSSNISGTQQICSTTTNNQTALCTIGSTGCEGCGKCVVLNQTGVNNLIKSGADRVSASPGIKQVNQQVAGMIDHTVLKPNTTETDIRKICEEARKYKFASVCVNPSYVALSSDLLKGTDVKICTVIGFPLGATTSTTKAMETKDAIANGATEIDMVINVGALKSGNNSIVKKDIEAVVEAARGRAIVKVILETSLLTDEEKVRASLLSKYAGADFVKTATGFGPGGATVEDIALMRKTVGAEMGVKASGGIRDLKTAQAMIAAGANRIGASASVAIVKGTATDQKGY